MKRYLCVGLSVAFVVGGLLVGTRHVAAQNGGNGSNVTYATRSNVALASPTRGVVFKTAAVNSDGTLANCFRCVSTAHLSTGEYQVIFDENVQANNGWSRWSQVDTLSIGDIHNVSCTTADRFLNANGVFVLCSNNSTGAAIDTSFFLFVAR